jgi:hypothetical protein
MQSDSDNSSLPAIIPPTPEHMYTNGLHNDAPVIPYIRVNDRYLNDIADDAQRAVQAAFVDTLFLREGKLVHLTMNEHGRPRIAQLSVPALRDRMRQPC